MAGMPSLRASGPRVDSGNHCLLDLNITGMMNAQ